MKKLMAVCAVFVSLSSFAENSLGKVYVHFNLSSDSAPRMIERSQELQNILMQELNAKKFNLASTGADADFSIDVNVSFGGEPFYGAIKQCQAWVNIYDLKKNTSRYYNVTDHIGLFMSAKGCARRVEKLFSEIPSSEGLGL